MERSALKLFLSPCPNDTFMFDALVNDRIEHDGVRFATSYFDIEELNRAVRAGEPDVCKISYAVWPAVSDRYTLLESGSALGRGNGPLLVRRPDGGGALHRVAVPGLHTTACALMRRLFPETTELVPRLFSEIAPAVARGEYDAGVLIHEGRFVYQRHHLELAADLGAMWEVATGLPLPLGAIVIRRSLGEELKRRIEERLRASIRYAFEHPAVSRPFVKAHAQEMEDSVIDRHIALFVNEFSLDLGPEGHRAVEALVG